MLQTVAFIRDDKLKTYIVHPISDVCNLRVSTPAAIESRNWPSHYPDTHFCAWRVSAPEGHVIQIVFDDLDVEYTR